MRASVLTGLRGALSGGVSCALRAGACTQFGTVIGPEANEAHRDHFHLDMKKRPYGGYCE